VADEPSKNTQLSELLDDFPDVTREIASNDAMYAYNPDSYFYAGQTALRCIRLAMLAAQLKTVGRVLDFASGHGRVLRYLKAAFPDAALTAVDIRGESVGFCSRVFGATGVVSTENPEEIELDGPFDLLWCGSLLTHVDSDRWVKFIKLFESILSPGGVAVFTVYGRLTARLLRTGENSLNMTEEQVKKVLRDYDETGFGFQKTAPDGDAVTSRTWACNQLDEAPSLDLLLYMERSWAGQDVIACAKNAGDPLRARG
jgi:SAM-dependent methyltransferase